MNNSHKQKDISLGILEQVGKDGDYIWRSVQHFQRHIRNMSRAYYKLSGYPADGYIVSAPGVIRAMHPNIKIARWE